MAISKPHLIVFHLFHISHRNPMVFEFNNTRPINCFYCSYLPDCCDGFYEIILEKNDEHDGNYRKYVHGAIYLLIMPFQMPGSCSVIAHEKGCIISEGLMLFVIRLKTVFVEHSPQISLVCEGSLISD